MPNRKSLIIRFFLISLIFIIVVNCIDACSIINCTKCKEQTTNNCAICNSGFTRVVTDGTCTPCLINNCLNCISPSYCLLCQNGFYRASNL